MKITKDMTIGEIVRKYPKTIDVFMKYHMMCFGCGVANVETLEQGCQSHEIDVEDMLKDLNEAVEEEE
ncbi:MAG: DUF1858 domain-containing protein [archaeon]